MTEIGYVIKDAKKWEVDPERTASKFDTGYYRGLLEKAWLEMAFCVQVVRSPEKSPLVTSKTSAIDDRKPKLIHPERPPFRMFQLVRDQLHPIGFWKGYLSTPLLGICLGTSPGFPVALKSLQ
jgi:hypothetical protein